MKKEKEETKPDFKVIDNPLKTIPNMKKALTDYINKIGMINLNKLVVLEVSKQFTIKPENLVKRLRKAQKETPIAYQLFIFRRGNKVYMMGMGEDLRKLKYIS